MATRTRHTAARRLLLLLALQLVAALTPLAAHAATNERYVAPSGADSNPGTATAPWRTVTHGLRTVVAGQTLWIRGGTYTETVSGTLHKGTSGARITVRGYPGEHPLVRGLVRLTDPDYWTLSDLAFTW